LDRVANSEGNRETGFVSHTHGTSFRKWIEEGLVILSEAKNLQSATVQPDRFVTLFLAMTARNDDIFIHLPAKGEEHGRQTLR
jgi:hypothetical protein